MSEVLIPVLVAGSAAGLASYVVPLPTAVGLALLASNVVGEYLRSKRALEAMSWPRALSKGLLAGAIAFVVLSLIAR
jgi:hypothetical protein